MAKLKVSSSASGTGTVTLIAPATSTDRTITLPDESITLGGGVDGIVSTADATAITIDSSENVGIGTGVPISELSIGSTSVSSYPTYSNPGSGVNQSFFASNINSGDSYNARLDIVSVAGNTDATNGGGSISFYTQPKVTPFAPIERLQLTRDGRGLSQFTAKAWLNYDGTINGILGSHNISSVTDSASGDFNLNFATSMANANYSIVGTSKNEGTAQFMGIQIRSLYSSYARMLTVRMDESDPEYGIDKAFNCYMVFGD